MQAFSWLPFVLPYLLIWLLLSAVCLPSGRSIVSLDCGYKTSRGQNYSMGMTQKWNIRPQLIFSLLPISLSCLFYFYFVFIYLFLFYHTIYSIWEDIDEINQLTSAGFVNINEIQQVALFQIPSPSYLNKMVNECCGQQPLQELISPWGRQFLAAVIADIMHAPTLTLLL